MCVCVCVCTCKYVYTYIHKCIHTCRYYIHTCTHIPTTHFTYTLITSSNGLQNFLREDLEMAQDNKLMQLPVKYGVDEVLEAYLKSRSDRNEDDKNMVEVKKSIVFIVFQCKEIYCVYCVSM